MIDSGIRPGERVKDVHLPADALSVDLIDWRTIIVPLVWYPRLLEATPEQRCNWRVSGAGYVIHWPDIDEDLSTDDSTWKRLRRHSLFEAAASNQRELMLEPQQDSSPGF